MRRVVVVGVDLDHAHAVLRPFRRQPLGDRALRGLALAVIADEDNRLEPTGLEAAGDTLEHAGEHRLGHSERSGKAHVTGRRIVVAFRHVADDGRNERAPQVLGDAARGLGDDIVVLAEDHVRTVLLDAARRHDDGRISGIDGAAHLHPCHVLQLDAGRQRRRQAAGEHEAGEQNRRRGKEEPLTGQLREGRRDRHGLDLQAGAFKRGAVRRGCCLPARRRRRPRAPWV